MIDLAKRAGRAESIHWLTLDAITVLPQTRKRFDQALIAVLADNIREHGIMHPLICCRRNGRLELLDGERRHRAGGLLGLDRVPVRIIDDPLTATQILARQLSCNIHREDLSIVERAEGIQLLMDQGQLSAEQAATCLGLSPSTVSRTLPVLRLPEDLKAKAASGELSADGAYLLTRVSDPAQQAALAARVIAGELTRDALALQVRALESGKPAPATPAMSKATSPGSKKTPVWRITRTIAPGISLSVTGAGAASTLDGLVNVLAQFITRGRDACVRGATSVPRFLSTFRHDQPAGGVTP
ncbi:MAG: ParB/RepB/Spo0J family partition protein [Phycisphaeraceae bacterium]|nr:ParB/RepB/Spo0J family partition protein [Phycisphaeraceae bacterium]